MKMALKLKYEVVQLVNLILTINANCLNSVLCRVF